MQVNGRSSLGDAAELLSMLSSLFDMYSRSNGQVEIVPWGGLKLTLEQCRRIVEAAEGGTDGSLLPQPQISTHDSSLGRMQSSLADRIVRVPRKGRVRELHKETGEHEGGQRPDA